MNQLFPFPGSQRTEQNVRSLLVWVLAGNDVRGEFWPADNVNHARISLFKMFKRIPSVEEFCLDFGTERSIAMIPSIIERRKLDNLLLGCNSPCHYCGGNEGLKRFSFGLMSVEESKKSWGIAASSAVVSAVLLPVFGAYFLAGPKKSFSGIPLALRVVVCKQCRHAGSFLFLPWVYATKERAAHHPLWQNLQDIGFTKFFGGENLPSVFERMEWDY
jgi:hypothetical protein